MNPHRPLTQYTNLPEVIVHALEEELVTRSIEHIFEVRQRYVGRALRQLH